MISKAQVMAMAAGDSWLAKGANVLMFGPPGGGKSHLAAAIGLVLNTQDEQALEIFNVSGEEDLSVLEVARRVCEITGVSTGLHFIRDRVTNDAAYRIDDSRLRSLGYRQKSSVDQELRAIYREMRARVRRFADEERF